MAANRVNEIHPSGESALDLLENELLCGLEGEDVEMTPGDWNDIENEALKILEAKKPRWVPEFIAISKPSTLIRKMLGAAPRGRPWVSG